MFYAAYIDQNGERQEGIYSNSTEGWTRYHADTFSPETKELYLIEFKVKGKTYAERKESLYETAIEFQHADSDVSGGLSWGEIFAIETWFRIMGKRYGMLKEFRENAIC